MFHQAKVDRVYVQPTRKEEPGLTIGRELCASIYSAAEEHANCFDPYAQWSDHPLTQEDFVSGLLDKIDEPEFAFARELLLHPQLQEAPFTAKDALTLVALRYWHLKVWKENYKAEETAQGRVNENVP